MLGPGTRITHAAVAALADNACLAVWCGEEGVRFYALGQGATRHAGNLLRQAALCTRPAQRLQVVRRMYDLRFDEPLDPGLSLQQIRGMEGVRVREAYARASRDTAVEWKGRNYDRGNWAAADPVNRALSAGNACLYGVCQAAIVALGYSPALGFIHTGKQLSFVYDVADFYKTSTTIPLAFQTARENPEHLEREMRIRCRDAFVRLKLLDQVVRDVEHVLKVDLPAETDDFDEDPALPGALWDPEAGEVPGGAQYAPQPEDNP